MGSTDGKGHACYVPITVLSTLTILTLLLLNPRRQIFLLFLFKSEGTEAQRG